MNDKLQPIVKSIARLIRPEEMTNVTGAISRVTLPTNAQGSEVEETYRAGAKDPSTLDTVISG